MSDMEAYWEKERDISEPTGRPMEPPPVEAMSGEPEACNHTDWSRTIVNDDEVFTCDQCGVERTVTLASYQAALAPSDPVEPAKCLCGTMQDGRPIVVGACPVHGDLSPVDPVEGEPVAQLVSKIQIAIMESEHPYLVDRFDNETLELARDIAYRIQPVPFASAKVGDPVGYVSKRGLSCLLSGECEQISLKAEPQNEDYPAQPDLIYGVSLYTSPSVEGEGAREALEQIDNRDVWERTWVDEDGETQAECRYCYETHGDHDSDCPVAIAREARASPNG